MQLGRLAVRQVCLTGHGEARPCELLLAVGGGLLLGCDEVRMACRTKGGVQALPPFSCIEATCWFAGLYSFPQAAWGHFGPFGCLTVAADPLLGTGWLGAANWDRGVPLPVTVGDIAVCVSLQGRGATG